MSSYPRRYAAGAPIKNPRTGGGERYGVIKTSLKSDHVLVDLDVLSLLSSFKQSDCLVAHLLALAYRKITYNSRKNQD